MVAFVGVQSFFVCKDLAKLLLCSGFRHWLLVTPFECLTKKGISGKERLVDGRRQEKNYDMLAMHIFTILCWACGISTGRGLSNCVG